jgi:23S rRNA (cytidine1920-2'-O)/16S rRNA (cytidine1409-2'-O)-methyltransferase
VKSFHARTPKARPQQPIGGDAAAPLKRPTRRSGGAARADAVLVERGLAPSRTAAQRLIEAGRVLADGRPVQKAAQELPGSVELGILDDAADRYVSRGGIKLAGALAASGIDVRGRSCLDIGQSTGGFTDCLLQHGATQVVGIDVGHGQLHPKLAADPRVACLEGINARELEKSALAARRDASREPLDVFDLVVGDVSFISLTLILPRLPALLAADGDLLLLVKPQFEVGPQGVGKGGIVRDAAHYGEVETKLRQCCAANHLRVIAWFDSPITGTDGNREFFLHAKHEND